MKNALLVPTLVLAAMATAFADASDDETGADVVCTGCISGVGIWNHIMTISTSTGSCTTNQLMWRRDGICKEAFNSDGEFVKCVEIPCQFLLDPGCSGSGCNEILAGAYSSDGSLGFSFSGCGLYIFGAPFCDWGLQISQFAYNPTTGDIETRANWLGCSACKADGAGEPGGGGGSGGGSGSNVWQGGPK